jgi:DNA-binding NarL/FixJ family response regulator
MIDKQLEEPTDPIQADYFDLLNEKEKELFQLHLDGFNNLEIAGKHTINEKTVRNKLSMTRKKIAHFYKNQFLFFL